MANNNKHPEQAGAKAAARPAAKPAQPSEPLNRLQRILASVGGSILGLGVVSIVALLIGESFALKSVQENIGFWGLVAFVPDIALPVGFALIIALLIVTFVRRSRAAKGASN